MGTYHNYTLQGKSFVKQVNWIWIVQIYISRYLYYIIKLGAHDFSRNTSRKRGNVEEIVQWRKSDVSRAL